MDIDYSFEFKKAGYRVVVSAEVAERVVKHEHREWYSLTPEEQATKSKKNYDIFRRRRHHCQSLLVMNYAPGQPAPWGHDHEVPEELVDPRFEHGPYAGKGPHSHEHKHWPDHSHTHPHVHQPSPRWFHPPEMATYVPSREDLIAESGKNGNIGNRDAERDESHQSMLSGANGSEGAGERKQQHVEQ